MIGIMGNLPERIGIVSILIEIISIIGVVLIITEEREIRIRLIGLVSTIRYMGYSGAQTGWIGIDTITIRLLPITLIMALLDSREEVIERVLTVKDTDIELDPVIKYKSSEEIDNNKRKGKRLFHRNNTNRNMWRDILQNMKRVRERIIWRGRLRRALENIIETRPRTWVEWSTFTSMFLATSKYTLEFIKKKEIDIETENIIISILEKEVDKIGKDNNINEEEKDRIIKLIESINIEILKKKTVL